MKNASSFIICLLLFSWFGISCKKDEVTRPTFDAARQARIDDSLLVQFLSARGILDSCEKTSTGLYFRITKPTPDSLFKGTDSAAVNPDYVFVTNGRVVFLRYQGRLLNDTIFDQNLTAATAFKFSPGVSDVIEGLNEGILKFKKGEEGNIYLPSRLGYGNVSNGKIPASSCLNFFIRVANLE